MKDGTVKVGEIELSCGGGGGILGYGRSVDQSAKGELPLMEVSQQ